MLLRTLDSLRRTRKGRYCRIRMLRGSAPHDLHRVCRFVVDRVCEPCVPFFHQRPNLGGVDETIFQEIVAVAIICVP